MTTRDTNDTTAITPDDTVRVHPLAGLLREFSMYTRMGAPILDAAKGAGYADGYINGLNDAAAGILTLLQDPTLTEDTIGYAVLARQMGK